MVTSSQRKKPRQIVIIGGGAAGCFASIHAAQVGGDSAHVTLLESGRDLLTKVRISGGGRCNVTHACFDPKELVKNYPRGERELLGPFHQFQPRDMIHWLEARGVELKTEKDGRIFPASDLSTTIINCLLREMEGSGVQIQERCAVVDLKAKPKGGFTLTTSSGDTIRADRLMIAVGSLKGSPLGKVLKNLGHSLTTLAPSLFAFNSTDARFAGLAGISVANAEVTIPHLKQSASGPLLITHKGISGPAVLKLSAQAARKLATCQYQFEVKIDWLGGDASKVEALRKNRTKNPRKKLINVVPDGLPQRLWDRLLESALPKKWKEQTWAHLSQKEENALVQTLCEGLYPINGKSTHKEEFVTCGGVKLKEVNFKTMESRILPGLYFGGECLDIDGVTGGFNFQAAWTAGHLAGVAMGSEGAFGAN